MEVLTRMVNHNYTNEEAGPNLVKWALQLRVSKLYWIGSIGSKKTRSKQPRWVHQKGDPMEYLRQKKKNP